MEQITDLYVYTDYVLSKVHEEIGFYEYIERDYEDLVLYGMKEHLGHEIEIVKGELTTELIHVDLIRFKSGSEATKFIIEHPDLIYNESDFI